MITVAGVCIVDLATLLAVLQRASGAPQRSQKLAAASWSAPQVGRECASTSHAAAGGKTFANCGSNVANGVFGARYHIIGHVLANGGHFPRHVTRHRADVRKLRIITPNPNRGMPTNMHQKCLGGSNEFIDEKKLAAPTTMNNRPMPAITGPIVRSKDRTSSCRGSSALPMFMVSFSSQHPQHFFTCAGELTFQSSIRLFQKGEPL